MNLKYNTLWIENEQAWLEQTIESISDIVSEYGFKLLAEKCFSAEELYTKLNKNPHYLDQFDLILTDYNLGSGDNGNVLIHKIREDNANPYTDIIFYGQDQEAISQELKEHFIEGVYQAKRGQSDFAVKFEKVFKSTIKKIQDVSMMRGLVMAETSEMGIQVLAIIKKYLEKQKEGQVISIKQYVVSKVVADKLNSLKKYGEEIAALELLEMLEHRFFDDSQKLRIFKHIFDKHDMWGKDIHTSYEKKILSVRNELAHCKEISENGIKKLVTNKGEKTIGEEECLQIRKDLIEHQRILMEIEKFVRDKL